MQASRSRLRQRPRLLRRYLRRRRVRKHLPGRPQLLRLQWLKLQLPKLRLPKRQPPQRLLLRKEMFILSNELNNFADVAENIKQIRFNMEEAKVKYGRENDDIKVMAVTKTVPAEKVNFAVSRGFELLGENRVQEFLQKKELYVKNAEINFIGHLQSNKIKYIIDSVTMIQSADSIALAGEISKQAEKHGKVMDILCII